jgi:hypothetical protein
MLIKLYDIYEQKLNIWSLNSLLIIADTKSDLSFDFFRYILKIYFILLKYQARKVIGHVVFLCIKPGKWAVM